MRINFKGNSLRQGEKEKAMLKRGGKPKEGKRRKEEQMEGEDEFIKDRSVNALCFPARVFIALDCYVYLWFCNKIR